MVDGVRAATAALGSPERDRLLGAAQHCGRAAQPRCRTPNQKGEIFEADMIDAKRPGGGLSPMLTWLLVGRVASRDYGPDDVITEESVTGHNDNLY